MPVLNCPLTLIVILDQKSVINSKLEHHIAVCDDRRGRDVCRFSTYKIIVNNLPRARYQKLDQRFPFFSLDGTMNRTTTIAAQVADLWRGWFCKHEQHTVPDERRYWMEAWRTIFLDGSQVGDFSVQPLEAQGRHFGLTFFKFFPTQLVLLQVTVILWMTVTCMFTSVPLSLRFHPP